MFLLYQLTVAINPLKHLQYLYRNFLKLHGVVKQMNLTNIEEGILQETSIIVNCTGLGAQSLKGVEDLSVHPIQGQIVVAKSNIDIQCRFFRHHNDPRFPTYLIPRGNGEIILGGTRVSLLHQWRLYKISLKY